MLARRRTIQETRCQRAVIVDSTATEGGNIGIIAVIISTKLTKSEKVTINSIIITIAKYCTIIIVCLTELELGSGNTLVKVVFY